jgi:hypothetical protein
VTRLALAVSPAGPITRTARDPHGAPARSLAEAKRSPPCVPSDAPAGSPPLLLSFPKARRSEPIYRPLQLRPALDRGLSVIRRHPRSARFISDNQSLHTTTDADHVRHPRPCPRCRSLSEGVADHPHSSHLGQLRGGRVVGNTAACKPMWRRGLGRAQLMRDMHGFAHEFMHELAHEQAARGHRLRDTCWYASRRASALTTAQTPSRFSQALAPWAAA